MKLSFGQALAIAGPMVTMQSIAWEYVRMNPAYRFSVEPWAMRGFETTQGIVFAAIGAAMLVIGLLTMWRRSSSLTPALATVAFGAVAGAVIAAIGLGADAEYTPPGVLVMIASAFVGVTAVRLVMALVRPRLARLSTGIGRSIVTIVGVIVAVVLILPSLANEQIGPVWLVVLALLGLVAVFSFSLEPRDLAANRYHMLTAAIALFVILLSGGSLRTHLIEQQIAEIGVGGSFRDSQITNGWLMANLGMLLAFVGSVSLWAQRRDHLANQKRLADQRAAAEKSAREMAERTGV